MKAIILGISLILYLPTVVYTGKYFPLVGINWSICMFIYLGYLPRMVR